MSTRIPKDTATVPSSKQESACAAASTPSPTAYQADSQSAAAYSSQRTSEERSATNVDTEDTDGKWVTKKSPLRGSRQRGTDRQQLGKDGHRSHNHSDEVHSILYKWLRENLIKPYPTIAEKKRLAVKTKLRYRQVSYWYTNARRRLVPKMIEAENQRRTACGQPPLKVEAFTLPTGSSSSMSSSDDADYEKCNEDLMPSPGLETKESEAAIAPLATAQLIRGGSVVTSPTASMPGCQQHVQFTSWIPSGNTRVQADSDVSTVAPASLPTPADTCGQERPSTLLPIPAAARQRPRLLGSVQQYSATLAASSSGGHFNPVVHHVATAAVPEQLPVHSAYIAGSSMRMPLQYATYHYPAAQHFPAPQQFPAAQRFPAHHYSQSVLLHPADNSPVTHTTANRMVSIPREVVGPVIIPSMQTVHMISVLPGSSATQVLPAAYLAPSPVSPFTQHAASPQQQQQQQQVTLLQYVPGSSGHAYSTADGVATATTRTSPQ